jgi:hypothetical protein
MDRANVVTAFMVSPLLPEPNHLRVDYITTLLALAVDGPVHKAAIKLLALAYFQQEAAAIWLAWAPHLAPPLGHLLAKGTPLPETIMQSTCTPTLQPKRRGRQLANSSTTSRRRFSLGHL